MYDLIGDIHGHARPLENLLTQMGYREGPSGWAHPERTAVFLGDFVDRGPDQKRVIDIARTMVEAGNALAVMGNHEFNAVSFATPAPDRPGEFLRPHTSKNREEHQAFLEQLDAGSDTYHDTLAWFRTLPIYLDLPGFRVVHACWDAAQIEALQPWLDNQNCLTSDGWAAANNKGSTAHQAIEVLLKGYEITLPDGYSFKDKNNHTRTEARVRWWAQEDLPIQDAVLIPGGSQVQLPDLTIKASDLPGYDNTKPLFIGHYWWSGPVEPITPTVACLDYSIAGEKPGKLVAYRWHGEKLLKTEHFSVVGPA